MLTGDEMDGAAQVRHFHTIDLAIHDPASRYKLLTGSVVPRPIALVSTLGKSGVVNLAPFSQFMIFAANPGLLGFSASERADGPKHTIQNLQTLGQMVINITHSNMARQVQMCSEELPAESSEAEHSELELMESVIVRPPRVAQAPVQFECELDRIIDIGDIPNRIVVARILKMHVREDVLLKDSKIDTAALDPLGRIGGRNYCAISRIDAV